MAVPACGQFVPAGSEEGAGVSTILTRAPRLAHGSRVSFCPWFKFSSGLWVGFLQSSMQLVFCSSHSFHRTWSNFDCPFTSFLVTCLRVTVPQLVT